MSFPFASETPPTLTPYQCQFNGYKFGSGTAFKLKKIDGLDLPVVRSGDSGRPRTDGMFAGLDVLGQREVTFQGDMMTDGVSLGHALQEARKALKPTGVTELPLYINYPAVGTICTMARVRKRAIPVDFTFTAGNLAENVTVLLASTDPKFYGTTLTASITGTVPTTTLAFPWAFPLTFGSGSYWASAVFTVGGEVETFPRILIEGPCNRPTIWNESIAGVPTLSFDLEIPTGGKLELDTDFHTALYYEPGSTEGIEAGSTILPGSEWWALPTGSNSIGFNPGTLETTGKATLEYAPAYEL